MLQGFNVLAQIGAGFSFPPMRVLIAAALTYLLCVAVCLFAFVLNAAGASPRLSAAFSVSGVLGTVIWMWSFDPRVPTDLLGDLSLVGSLGALVWSGVRQARSAEA
jgi:hypothetical protein